VIEMPDLAAADIAESFGIKGLAVDDGVATLTTKPTTEQAKELVLAMSLACGRMLDDDQAPNYVEFEVQPARHPGYIVHVRRAGGPSPHTLRREAEARAEQVEAILADIRALHVPTRGHNPECECGMPPHSDRSCTECRAAWPCATIRALTTEETDSDE
jgi:hypothetical protein